MELLEASPAGDDDGVEAVGASGAREARRRALVACALLVVAIIGVRAATGSGGDDDAVAVSAAAADPTTTTRLVTSTTATTTATTAPVTTTTTIAATSTTAPAPRQTTPATTRASAPPTSAPEASCCPADPVPELPPMHRGRVVDTDGRPLAGVHVYTTDEMPHVHLGVTAADGTFAVACDDGSLLFWGKGPDYSSSDTSAERPWAPIFVGAGFGGAAVPCTTDASPTLEVVMQPGVTITGVLRGPDGSPRTLEQHQSGSTIDGTAVGGGRVRIRVYTSDPSGRYWLYGVPAGELRADSMGIGLTVHAEPGETVFIDFGPRPDGSGPIQPGTPP